MTFQAATFDHQPPGTIASPELPGAIFLTPQALLADVADAVAYEKAAAIFALTRDEAALYEALMAIGYTADEIEWHVAHPGERMEQVYE